MTRPQNQLSTLLVLCVVITLIPAVWLVVSSPISAGDPFLADARVTPAKLDVKDFMSRKLAAINAAMDAAARDDYDAVESAGFELIQLSKDAAWSRRANSAYLQDTADFVQSARFMMRMAQQKDAQGVASSYAAVSACCLNCHRHTRNPKVAAALPLSGETVVMHSPSAGNEFSTAW